MSCTPEKHCACRGFLAYGNSWVSPALELHGTYKWDNSKLHHLLMALALIAIGKLHVLHIIWLKNLVVMEGRQVRSLADPHAFSTLKVQRGTGTLNETLRLSAVHPRMAMHLAVLVCRALLPQVHSFNVTALFY